MVGHFLIFDNWRQSYPGVTNRSNRNSRRSNQYQSIINQSTDYRLIEAIEGQLRRKKICRYQLIRLISTSLDWLQVIFSDWFILIFIDWFLLTTSNGLTFDWLRLYWRSKVSIDYICLNRQKFLRSEIFAIFVIFDP